jgi:hypothetical protein
MTTRGPFGSLFVHRRRGRRAPRTLRAAVLLVFTLGLATQSLLGVLGEMHELAKHSDVAHGLVHHVTPHDHADDHAMPDGTGADEDGPLHVLLHHSHCCSHSTWMSGADAALAAVALASTTLPVDSTRHLPASRLTAPFRPPIPA